MKKKDYIIGLVLSAVLGVMASVVAMILNVKGLPNIVVALGIVVFVWMIQCISLWIDQEV